MAKICTVLRILDVCWLISGQSDVTEAAPDFPHYSRKKMWYSLKSELRSCLCITSVPAPDYKTNPEIVGVCMFALNGFFF
jgi:hypothetical protein